MNNTKETRDHQQHVGRAMELEMRTSATPEKVWNAWADPERISQWFADKAEGWAHKGTQVTWIFDEFGYRLPYEVLESIPNESLAFGGQLPGRPPFLLEITIRREGGETVLRLVNSGFLEGGNFDEEYEGVVSGWTLALAMLKHYVEYHYGQTKQSMLIIREANADLTQLRHWYTEPTLLNRWLTKSTSGSFEVGKPYQLVLFDGTRLSGTVASISNREVALTWDERSAFFELKGWGSGDKKIIAVRVTSWNRDNSFLEDARSSVNGALDRLVAIFGT